MSYSTPLTREAAIRILKILPNRLMRNEPQMTHFEKKRRGINISLRTLTPLI